MSRAGDIIRKLVEVVESGEDGVPLIVDIVIPGAGLGYQRLDEGKFVDGRFQRNIRVDQPTHTQGQGQVHAHVFGRKGHELVVVNLDGTGSHGTTGRLHDNDAEALKTLGFSIRDDRIVEWWIYPDAGLEVLNG